MTDLVLLTSQFPYGIETETFLEAEISILAERFERVLILPSRTRDMMRPVPTNVEVVRMGWTAEPSMRARLAALSSSPATRTIRWSFGTPGDLAAQVRAPRRYVDVLGREVLKYRELNRFVRERGLRDAVFYDFWFANTTLALALLRKEGVIRRAVARAQRFDVYDDPQGPVPFRQAKAIGLDAVYPTSLAAERYLRARVPALHDKMEVHRLGVLDPGATTTTRQPNAVPLILTCALCTPVKRLHLIPEALAHLDAPFRWVHIGDGPERDPVEAAALKLLPAGSFEFLGQLTNAEVHEWYRTHSVQCLLSVSESEGEPVSMMEAISYGIPIVACDVGGVSELVTERTGILISEAASPKEIAAALRAGLVDGRFDPLAIKGEWRDRYDATANYERFAEALLKL